MTIVQRRVLAVLKTRKQLFQVEKEVLPHLVRNLLSSQIVPWQTQKKILQKRDTSLEDQNRKHLHLLPKRKLLLQKKRVRNQQKRIQKIMKIKKAGISKKINREKKGMYLMTTMMDQMTCILLMDWMIRSA